MPLGKLRHLLSKLIKVRLAAVTNTSQKQHDRGLFLTYMNVFVLFFSDLLLAFL